MDLPGLIWHESRARKDAQWRKANRSSKKVAFTGEPASGGFWSQFLGKISRSTGALGENRGLL